MTEKMTEKMVYVIRDNIKNYISDASVFRMVEGELFYCYFTGFVTGFIHYKNKNIAEKKLNKLQDFSNKYRLNKKFHIEYVNLYSINKGKFNVKNITEMIHESENLAYI